MIDSADADHEVATLEAGYLLGRFLVYAAGHRERFPSVCAVYAQSVERVSDFYLTAALSDAQNAPPSRTLIEHEYRQIGRRLVEGCGAEHKNQALTGWDWSWPPGAIDRLLSALEGSALAFVARAIAPLVEQDLQRRPSSQALNNGMN